MDFEDTPCKIILLIFINCSFLRAQDLTVRLADGDERRGRVEVFIDGEWGTICDDRWDLLDGDVVCRQLGFLYAEKVKDNAAYGEGQGQVYMDEVTCDGTERTLFDCQYSRHHNCHHSEDAGVICSNAFDIRLVNGDERQGRVEVYLDRQWGTVCADRWDIIDADIVCQQLGYLHAKNATKGTSSTWGESTSDILIGSVKCKGKENILSECSFVVHPNCTERELSGVACSADPVVRLRGGAGKHEGRVEIHADGLWGTVCDEGWNIRDANVVCRQMGFSEAVFASGKAYWGEGDSPILMSDVNCEGSERSLLACAFTRKHSCTHAQDAGVTCKKDQQILQITSCPLDIRVPVPPNVIQAPVEWDDPVVRGRLVNTTSSHESGSLFDLGLTQVTYNFTSKLGEVAFCSFYVTLCPADCSNARQYCPASITQKVEAGNTTSRIYWSELMFSKCNYSVSKTHSSGEEFSLGITEVTYTCTDSTFVYNLCNFDVHVISDVETTSSSISSFGQNLFDGNVWIIVTIALGSAFFVMILLLFIHTCRKPRSNASNHIQLGLNDMNIHQSVNTAEGSTYRWRIGSCSTYEASLKDCQTNVVYEEASVLSGETKKLAKLTEEHLYSKRVDDADDDFATYVTMK